MPAAGIRESEAQAMGKSANDNICVYARELHCMYLQTNVDPRRKTDRRWEWVNESFTSYCVLSVIHINFASFSRSTFPLIHFFSSSSTFRFSLHLLCSVLRTNINKDAIYHGLDRLILSAVLMNVCSWISRHFISVARSLHKSLVFDKFLSFSKIIWVLTAQTSFLLQLPYLYTFVKINKTFKRFYFP